MNDAAPERASTPDALASTLGSLREAARSLGVPLDRVLVVDEVAYATGIPAERVGALLAGADPGDDTVPTTFQRRLNHLRDTRLKDPGKGTRYSLADIAKGTGMSHQQVDFLLKGLRRPSLEHSAGLERFFGVEPGFFALSDREALVRYLRALARELPLLELADRVRAQRVDAVALRGPAELDADLLEELLPALAAALDLAAGEPVRPVIASDIASGTAAVAVCEGPQCGRPLPKPHRPAYCSMRCWARAFLVGRRQG